MEKPLNGLAIETFKKFDIKWEAIRNEINVVNFEMIEYEDKAKYSVFGEKESISYLLHFFTYHFEFKVKLLTFEYKAKSEIVKLEIDCLTLNVKEEIQYCCNSLQRRRNLNLVFITLISFTRYLESRRIICDMLLQKSPHIKIVQKEFGGKIIIYKEFQVKFAIFWTVECNSDYEVFDKIEIYYNGEELSSNENLRTIFIQLIEPTLDFNKKYRLWKDLLNWASVLHPALLEKPSDNISILSNNSQIIANRHKVKKEVECKNEDSETFATSSECIMLDHKPLICFKHSQMLPTNSEEVSVIFSNQSDDDVQIISEHDSSNNTSIGNSDCLHITSNKRKKKREPSIIEVISEDFIRLRNHYLNSNGNTVTNKASNVVPEEPTQSEVTIEFDVKSPPKKSKKMDDDLEITGITYLIPD